MKRSHFPRCRAISSRRRRNIERNPRGLHGSRPHRRSRASRKNGASPPFPESEHASLFFERAPLGYQALDEKGRFLAVNRTWLDILGYRRDEVLGRSFADFLAPEWREHFRTNFPRFKAAGDDPKLGLGVEFEMVKKDGARILVSFNGRIVRGPDDEFRHTQCIFHDITDRNRARKDLQWELTVNRAAAELSESLLATDFSVSDIARIILNRAKALTESAHGFVSTVDPETRNMISHTLTEMLAGECAVPEAGVIFPAGPDGRYPGLWGHAMDTLVPFHANAPDRHPAAGGLPPGHVPLDRFLAVPITVDGEPAGLIALANSRRDYTDKDLEAMIQFGELYALALQRSGFERERAALLRQLQQSQKLEAIGALAGGIAHDFNNILFPIIGYAEMALDDTEPDHPHHQFLSRILEGAGRARDLVTQILTFSRQTDGERRPMRVQTILKEVLKLIRSTLPSTIEVRREIDPDCEPVLADPAQIHSVAMNLITNAYHAMGENGGTLTVALENRRITTAESGPGLREGRYVLLTIADTGSGMPPEVRARAFDPYFTTKGPGQGTGLGLSVVHGVVRSCDGHIELDTAPGRGATFRIYLPRTNGGDGLRERFEAPEPGDGEHILVVDDEPAITGMIRRMLEGLNYAVTVRTESREALETVRRTPDRFDLLITDMTMPGMRGDQLVRRVREIRPDLPAILVSGFSELLTEEAARELGLADCLKKPVLRSNLSRSIRRALEKSPRKGAAEA